MIRRTASPPRAGRHRRGFRALIPLVLTSLVLIGACGLPTDERAVQFDADDLPEDLANTTTSTTTTTTTTTLPTDGTGDSQVAATTTSTTRPPAFTAPVDLFYTIGFQDDLASLRVELQEGAPLTQVLAQLEQPLAEVGQFGLRTAVRRNMITDVTVERGAATVSLNEDVIDQMSDTILRRAISQIVLTVTSFRPPDSGGIGTVRFEVNGSGLPVFVPAFGGSSEPGEEVAFSDFASLIARTSAPATTPVTSVPGTTPEETVA